MTYHFGDHEIRHGYTLDNIDQLARAAITRSRSSGSAYAADYDEQYAIAWDAIARHLYTTTDHPTGYDLIGAALTALSDDSNAHRRHHGYYDNTRAYGVYWTDISAPTPSPERGIVEWTALTQIWPQLAPYQRAALTALATFEDHQQAAEALGKSYKTFTTFISQARRDFLRLWHEGEEPSRPWGTDRRRSEGTRRNAVTRHVKYRKGRRKVEPVHGKVGTYRNHHCRCALCRRAVAEQSAARRAAAKAAKENAA